jgi:hypothetical protein
MKLFSVAIVATARSSASHAAEIDWKQIDGVLGRPAAVSKTHT